MALRTLPPPALGVVQQAEILLGLLLSSAASPDFGAAMTWEVPDIGEPPVIIH